MKYLFILLILAGLAVAEDSSFVKYTINPDSVWEKNDTFDNKLLEKYYVEKVEVCDTIWYYNQELKDSIWRLSCYERYISKKKNMIWLTDEECKTLIRILHYFDSVFTVEDIWSEVINSPEGYDTLYIQDLKGILDTVGVANAYNGLIGRVYSID